MEWARDRFHKRSEGGVCSPGRQCLPPQNDFKISSDAARAYPGTGATSAAAPQRVSAATFAPAPSGAARMSAQNTLYLVLGA